MQPRDIKNPGIIMEFKRVDKKKGEEKGDDAPGKTLDEALEQIEAREYETEMVASGVKDVLKFAIAFKGKKLWVRKAEMRWIVNALIRKIIIKDKGLRGC